MSCQSHDRKLVTFEVVNHGDRLDVNEHEPELPDLSNTELLMIVNFLLHVLAERAGWESTVEQLEKVIPMTTQIMGK